MRLIVAAVGRMKAGPERELLERYAARARVAGRPLGIAGLDFVEVEEGRGRSAGERRWEEATGLGAKLPRNAPLIVLDERGVALSSQAFAQRIGRLLEGGTSALAFAIGGPDGLDPAFRSAAREAVGFGAATIPHQLVRVLLAEQIYRAVTILTGHPYHRA